MFKDAFFIKHWSQVFSNHPSKQLEQPPGAIKRVLGNYCEPVDQFVATPFANFKVLEEASGYNIVEAINNSRYAKIWHGSLVGVGFLALLIGHVVSVYRTLRNDEKKSHFFYFRRLAQIDPNFKAKKTEGKDQVDYEILIAAAYFYSPDISRLVCWKRRVFCWGKRREEYARLMDYFEKERSRSGPESRLGKTNEEIRNSIFIQTIDELVKYLNEKTASLNLPKKFQQKEGTYLIVFSQEYSKVFSFDEEFDLPKKSIKSLGQSILEAIGEASFFYWLCMFAFYFAPTVGLVAGVSFPPLAAAFFFLTIRCVYVTYAFKKDSINKQIGSLHNTEVDYLEREALKRKYKSDDVELKKQEIFVKEQIVAHVGLTPFKDSKLHKDLRKVLGHRRFMKAVAIVNGFINGCFLPFFGIWLFSDLLKVVVGLAFGGSVVAGAAVPAAPAVLAVFAVISMVIASVTLLLGVGYGIKKAIAAAKEQDEKYEKLKNEVEKLENFIKPELEVLNVSLHEYDRLFRRYSLEQPRWTQGKKFLNRSWVVISRLGTGSLMFRLVIWGSITSFMSTAAVLAAAPITIPFIISFAAIFAVWHVCAYNIEKKWKKAENITNHFYSSRMVGVKEMAYKKAFLGKKEELRTDSSFLSQSLPSSKSEECLNAQNRDKIDLIKLHPNGSGDTSPDDTKAKISFKSSREETGREVSDSNSLNLAYSLRRGRARSFTEGFGSRMGKNDLFSSPPDLNPQVMACRRP